MGQSQSKKADDPLAALPSAKEVMKQIALREAERASTAMRELSAAEAEKKALIEKFSKVSGVSDEERMARAAAIIKRAANNGLTEVEIGRFPNELCTDHGRAINQREPGWEACRRSSMNFGKNISNRAGTRSVSKSSISPAAGQATSA
jgi:hypothetical protein